MGSWGTDTYDQPVSTDPMLAGLRRLTALADTAGNGGGSGEDEIYRGLARELLLAPGAEEVHVHHLTAPPGEDEAVDVYLAEGDGRLSYLAPRLERPAGVSWVADTRSPFLATDARELQASLPRLSETGQATCALLLPIAVRGSVQSVVVLVRRTPPDVFTERSVELACTLAQQAATALALVRARAEAGTDPVTGCMNHRAMRRRLHEEIGRAVRTGVPLSCLLIDLDNFKLVNDRDGHQAGDRVLREVGHALVGEFREFDRVARYGGDEFVVILPNADLESAAAAASRALTRLLALPAAAAAAAAAGGDRVAGDSLTENPVTGDQPAIATSPGTPASPGIVTSSGIGASIGVAQWQSPMSTDALLHACDAALLRSKRTGKGRVTRAPASS
jgi:diguanylate cyclase (GGDEF)-like protein